MAGIAPPPHGPWQNNFSFRSGDAASLLLGFNAEDKISGINLMSMAGD
jgi:hypothetical protein